MDFPHINNFLQFTYHCDGSCTAVDYLTEEEYEITQELAEVLCKMDGKRSLASFFDDNDDPYGMDWDEFEEELVEMNLLRRGRVEKDGFGSFRVALWMATGRCSKRMYIPAAILHVIVKYLWLPILLTGIISHIWQYNYYYLDYYAEFSWKTVVGILAGMIAGLMLHELSHAASGYVYGAPIFEIGIGLFLIFPGAYVAYDDSVIRDPGKALHTVLAGVEMNYLFAGILLIIQFFSPFSTGILYFAALVNITMGTFNLFATGSLDGYAALCILLRIPRTWGIMERGRILLGKSKVKGAEQASEGMFRIAMLLLSAMQTGVLFLLVMEIWCYARFFA